MADDPQAGSSPAPTATPVQLLENASAAQVDKWRLSGKVEDLGAPPATDPPQTPPADSSSATPDQPAAPTGASSQPDSEPGEKDKGKGLKARKAELDAEIAELEARLKRRAELRRQEAEPEPSKPAAKAAQSPAAASDDPEPDPSDATKYPDGQYDRAFMRDQARWIVREEKRAWDAKAAEEAKTQRLEQSEVEVSRAFAQRVESAKAKHPDFAEKVLYAPTEIVKDSPMDRWVLEAEDGAEVLYYLQTTPGETRRIASLPIIQQLRELARIGLSLSDAAPAVPLKTKSGAPAPAATLGDRPSAPSDDVARALAQHDEAAYIAAANAREMAARPAARRR
jgi:hypothetical protein